MLISILWKQSMHPHSGENTGVWQGPSDCPRAEWFREGAQLEHSELVVLRDGVVRLEGGYTAASRTHRQRQTWCPQTPGWSRRKRTALHYTHRAHPGGLRDDYAPRRVRALKWQNVSVCYYVGWKLSIRSKLVIRHQEGYVSCILSLQFETQTHSIGLVFLFSSTFPSLPFPSSFSPPLSVSFRSATCNRTTHIISGWNKKEVCLSLTKRNLEITIRG